MRFHADLHIHSKHSRATSRDCDLEHLAWWAARKGIAVVGTGDFTHPAWRPELKEKLRPAEPGLFRLAPEIEAGVAERLPRACPAGTRFMLSVEISTIYRKGERTRKVHHLIYVPDFDTANRVAARLARIGNIAADGRPILGLDSRHLLEITLEAGEGAYLVPAHIWTPWFSVLGSRSGFDSVVECYDDLAPHIFAVETGLSSDPAMNWRVAALDRFRLVSSSDAHSPAKLGREATAFDTELDYFAIRRALETGRGYVGTVEFFPEEGKYHLDGHRKCEVRLTPEETRRLDGRCPACGQPVTVGVLNRVETLADRGEDEARAAPPPCAGAVSSLVPLPEILSEITGTGTGAQAVARGYERLLGALGPELPMLEQVPVEDIERAGSPLLAEGIARLRAGRVIREAGYDGAYGTIRLFEDAELRTRTAGGLLFDAPAAPGRRRRALAEAPAERRLSPSAPGERGTPAVPLPAAPAGGGVLAGLDPEQRAAAACTDGPVAIVAGPGSGKTRVLTHRIAHLVAERGVPPAACLAVTFTRRAARELRERLAKLVPEAAPAIAVHTFHSLGLLILREHGAAAGLHRGFRIADEAERAALLAEALGLTPERARRTLAGLARAKRTQRPLVGPLAEQAAAYRRLMEERNWIDLDDLVGLAIQALESDPGLTALWHDRFRWISVDEVQDIDEQQYRLIRLLAPPPTANLCVIGDPDQAIYGFRGADAACFQRFARDYAGPTVLALRRNYRSTGTIVAAASQVVGIAELAEAVRERHERVVLHAAPSERAEAEFVVETIERLIGGHSFFSLDSGRSAGGEAGLSFGDIAVLCRTEALAVPVAEALARSGMPFRRHGHGALLDRPAVRALAAALEE
ncbi:MAG: UvrD-helicase domain-containing protein, partial [Rhodospirillaceae bacterium]|nr:UvrD-helicase domain-containing protein [Rhodospirillaceae bacterium]